MVAPGATSHCPPQLQPQALFLMASAFSPPLLGSPPVRWHPRASPTQTQPAPWLTNWFQLLRSMACMVEAESPEPPTSLDPLTSSSCCCGISHVFILDALLFPFIFQNSLFSLSFYLDMMKFQACSQLYLRFQSVLVWRISLHPRKWYWSEPGWKSQRSQSHHCGWDVRISNSQSYWLLVLLFFAVLVSERVEFV